MLIWPVCLDFGPLLGMQHTVLRNLTPLFPNYSFLISTPIIPKEILK